MAMKLVKQFQQSLRQIEKYIRHNVRRKYKQNAATSLSMRLQEPKIWNPLQETVRRTLLSVADLEPELYATEAFADIQSLQICDGFVKARVGQVFKEVLDSLRRPYEFIVVIPWIVHGGADLAAVYAVKALIDCHGLDSTLVLVADYDRLDARSWFPKDMAICVLSSFCSDLTEEERSELVELVIIALKPYSVININSAACWNAIKRRGRALSSFVNLYGMLFCRDYTDGGQPMGYADSHFRDCLPYLKRVYLDNATFKNELIIDFGIPESCNSKLVVLKQPIKAANAMPLIPKIIDNTHLYVFWAGRFCKQKNTELLMRISEFAPDITFDIWGRGDETEEACLKTFASSRSNFILRGPFANYEALPIEKYDAFLYTSLWDGIPTILIDTAASGIPIVASDSGGIKELVTKDTGWLIADINNEHEYIKALNQIRQDANEVMDRRSLMLSHVQKEHSWNSYLAVVKERPNFLGI